MDRINLDILKCLKQNARMPASEISRRVNLSVSSVIERIRRMEEEGLILQYSVVLDQKKMGNGFAMLIGIHIEHPRFYDSFVERVMRESNIFECQYLTGELDFLLHVYASSPEQLEKLHHDLANMEGVASIRSYFVLKTVKNSLFSRSLCEE